MGTYYALSSDYKRAYDFIADNQLTKEEATSEGLPQTSISAYFSDVESNKVQTFINEKGNIFVAHRNKHGQFIKIKKARYIK